MAVLVELIGADTALTAFSVSEDMKTTGSWDRARAPDSELEKISNRHGHKSATVQLLKKG